jgi:hypothetical protein
MAATNREHICEDRSSWLSMRNTRVCCVELHGSKAYLKVTYQHGYEYGTMLIRIHHCPFCAVPLGKRKKRELREAPTGLHSQLLQKNRQ